jgi:hypothetical protein
MREFCSRPFAAPNKEIEMSISRTAIYSSAVILAVIVGGPAQAQGGPKPGQGAWEAAPGHNANRAGGSAKEFAPGYQFQKDFKLNNTSPGASGLGGANSFAPGRVIAPGKNK